MTPKQLKQKAVEKFNNLIDLHDKRKVSWVGQMEDIKSFLLSQLDIAYKEGEKAGEEQGKIDSIRGVSC